MCEFLGAQLETQVLPLPKNLLKVPGRRSKATMELIFEAANLPPLGFKSYLVKKVLGAAQKMRVKLASKEILNIANEVR